MSMRPLQVVCGRKGWRRARGIPHSRRALRAGQRSGQPSVPAAAYLPELVRGPGMPMQGLRRPQRAAEGRVQRAPNWQHPGLPKTVTLVSNRPRHCALQVG